MRETIESVSFMAETLPEAAELVQFHSSQFAMPHRIVGRLTVNDVGTERQFDLEIDSASNQLLVRCEIEGLSPDLMLALGPVTSKQPLKHWLVTVGLPSNRWNYRIDARYEKAHHGAGHFRIFSTAGLADILPAVAISTAPVRIETELVSAIHQGHGIVLHPPLVNVTAASSPTGLIIVPGDAPQPVAGWLNSLQLRILTTAIGLRFEPNIAFATDALRQLTSWLADHKFRISLAATFLETQEPLRNEVGLSKLQQDLAALEADLTRETVQSFEEARKALATLALEPIRTLHALRMEIVTAVGVELFQTAIGIALVLGGFKLADFTNQRVMIGTLFAVALLFLIGFVMKAVVQESVFRDTLRLNRTLDRFPIAKAIPGFRAWHDESYRNSAASFYWGMGIGIAVATAPLLGVTTFWLTIRGSIEFPLRFAFGLFGILMVASCGMMQMVRRKAESTPPNG